MAQTSIKLNVTSFAIVSVDNPTSVIPVSTTDKNVLGKYADNSGIFMLFKFQNGLSTLGNKKLIDARATFAVMQPSSVNIYPLKSTFNQNTVTWNTKPDWYKATDVGIDPLSGANRNPNTKADITFKSYTEGTDLAGGELHSSIAKYFVTNNAAILMPSSTSYALWVYTKLTNGTSAPYVEIFYDDAVNVASQVVYRSGPASGYKNPRTATTFSWDYERTGNYYCANDFTQASAKLYWKKSTDSSYTQVSISGSTESVTIAADTFPTNSTIQWYVSGTDTAGTTSQTPVYSFSTVAGTAYAQCVSPINTVQDGSAPITFTWTLTSTDGQEPSGVDFWWKLPSEENNQWHAILNNATPRTSYTVPAGTFPGGEIQWLTRAYNIDGVAGPVSKPGSGYYSFICVAAPPAPAGLTATEVPRTTISWQSEEQQAYEITIDGKVVQKAFSASVNSFWHREPLRDGLHTISVRVQGQYSLWSQPSTVTINVQNETPSGWENVVLTGTFGTDAELSVDIGQVYPATVCWYRDGELIGRTKTTEAVQVYPFTDSRVLGTHEYHAELWFVGHYAMSNVVTGTMQTNEKKIAALDGSTGWLSLRLSENSLDTDEYQITQDQINQHIKGTVWPYGERSPFQNMTGSYNCAFTDRRDAEAFEALIGKPVIMKGKGEQVVTGTLSQVQKTVGVFYTSYRFSIQQTYFRDYSEQTV